MATSFPDSILVLRSHLFKHKTSLLLGEKPDDDCAHAKMVTEGGCVMDSIAHRPQQGKTAAMVCTWLALTLALGLAIPQPPNPVYMFVGAFAGAVVVVAGFFAASSVRPSTRRQLKQRTRLAVLSLLAGLVLGIALLTVLVALASVEPAVRARFAGRIAEPAWRPWALAFESSILEEVMYRLFAMSTIAWLATRLVKRPGAAVTIALVVSAVLFGLAHLPAWSLVTHTKPALIGTVLMLNGIGGVLFGWVFWHWGLAYAMLCHFAADVVIQALGPRLLA